jgi:C-terminal processing protease CtpA/Prc
MKAMPHIAEGIVIMLMIAASPVFAARGSASGDSPKDEKAKKSGWIGVVIKDVSERIAHKYKLDSDKGAYVSEVIDESPADSAGIKEGDIIVAFNGKKIDDPSDLIKAVRKTRPATKVTVAIMREGEKKEVSLVVGRNKKHTISRFFRMPTVPHFRIYTGSRILGLELMNLNEQLGEYFGAPDNEGVLVEKVQKGSAGDKAGFKAGDVIIRAGKRTVDDIEDISRELRKHDEGENVEFEVLRKGNRRTLSVEVEEQGDSNWNYFFDAPKLRMRLALPPEIDDADAPIPPPDEVRFPFNGREMRMGKKLKDLFDFERTVPKRPQRLIPFEDKSVSI